MLAITFILLYVGSVAKGAVLVDDSVNAVFPPRDEFEPQLNSTECGGLLVSDGGYISYKYGEKYDNNERCVWTIRTIKWQTSFLMHSASFHSEKDRLLVYVVGADGALELQAKIDSSTGRDIVGVIGPTVILVFTTDSSGQGNGFFLEYFPFGYNEVSGFSYSHSHLDSPSGHAIWPAEPVEYLQNALSTITLSPPLPNVTTKFSLSLDKVDLMTLLRGCANNFLSVHQLYQDGFVLRLRYCEPDLQTSVTFTSSSPLLITYSATVGPQQGGISFSWKLE